MFASWVDSVGWTPSPPPPLKFDSSRRLSWIYDCPSFQLAALWSLHENRMHYFSCGEMIFYGSKFLKVFRYAKILLVVFIGIQMVHWRHSSILQNRYLKFMPGYDLAIVIWQTPALLRCCQMLFLYQIFFLLDQEFHKFLSSSSSPLLLSPPL